MRAAVVALAVLALPATAAAQHAPALVVEYHYTPPLTTAAHVIRVDAAGNLTSNDGSGGPPATRALSAADLARVRAAVAAARRVATPHPSRDATSSLVFPGNRRVVFDVTHVPPAYAALTELLIQLAPPGAEPAIS